MSEIFISYARSTTDQARQITEALRELGYSAWRDDELPPHRPYAEVITERLDQAKAVLVLWSEDAVRSQWVCSEANRAREKNKLVQMSLDGVAPPMPFDQIHCTELRGWSGDPLEPGWQRMMQSISELVGREAETIQAPERRPFPARRWLVASVAVFLLLLGIGAYLSIARPWQGSQVVGTANASLRIEVTPFTTIGNDPEARAFTDGLAGHVVAIMKEGRLSATEFDPKQQPDASGRSPRPDLKLGGTVVRLGDTLRVQVALRDPRSNATLWSKQFERPVAQESALRDWVAGQAAHTALAASVAFGPKGPRVDADTLALFMRGKSLSAVSVDDATYSAEALGAAEQVVARAPDFAAGHAELALQLWVEVRNAQPAQQMLLISRARREAEQAIRLNPSEAGAAYLALHFVENNEAPSDYAGMEARLNTVRRSAPDPSLLADQMCSFLDEVGRAKESLYYCRLRQASQPLSGYVLERYARATASAGDPQLAARIADRAARFNPEHEGLRYLRLNLEAFGGPASYAGSPVKALALLRDPASAPPFEADGLAAFELLIKARQTGSPTDADRAMAAMRLAFGRPEHFWGGHYVVASATVLGRIDEAFAFLDSPRFPRGGPIMAHYAEPLRRDPRFWPLAARAGLARYWTTSGKWPDFCREPTYPLDCRAEAARVKDVPLGVARNF